MGLLGAKAFRGQRLYFLFLMQLCHFDVGLQSIIFQDGARFGKPLGMDHVLQHGINDIHQLLFVGEFPAADFPDCLCCLRSIAYLQEDWIDNS